jgi:alpha-L-rhamnosidase
MSQGLARAQEGTLRADRLRCEAKVNPLGIDVPTPRLDWLVTSERRNAGQTAYRVIVARSDATLAKDEGDLWDTGKVMSDETLNITYAGKALESHQPVVWKVMVWDRDDRPSAWSEPARWSMGLLRPEDWEAQWIGYDAARVPKGTAANFENASWIWHAADKVKDAPKGHRLFITSLDIPADAKIAAADLLVTADDNCKFTINGTLVASVTGHKTPIGKDIAAHLKPGPNSIRVEAANGEPGPAGLIARTTVKLASGQVLTKFTDASWKSTDNPGANWHNRPIDSSAWPNASVVGAYGDAPWGKVELAGLFLPPAPYLRTEFQTGQPVRRAVLYVTALGDPVMYVNGKPVTDDRYVPGWTDYNKRVYYRAYDVTKHIIHGANGIGCILGDGWFSGHIGFAGVRDHYGKSPRLLAQLHLEYSDGSTEEIGTGPDWRANIGGVLEADFLMGEVFNPNAERRGWSEPLLDTALWRPVDVGSNEVKPVVQAHPGPPVRTFAELRPKSVRQVRPDAYILDMGQNFAGVARLKVEGAKPGQEITLRFAERLDADGSLYTTNLRLARSIDRYICRGEGVETWEPRFTFHGFQYVEVSGLGYAPKADTITGVAFSSDTPVVGSFACSDPMLNQLHSNAYWTQRANFIDIPTDCPQRDERLGWTGDAQVYIRTASLNCDVQAFFDKWLVDLTDGQRPDGQFPMIAPVKVAGDDGGPAWADAGTVCPWTVYEVYADRSVLERQYPSMKKFVEFTRARCTPDLLPPESFHAFGDWLSIKAETPKDVIFMAYFALSTRLTMQAAQVLGKDEDAKALGVLLGKIKAAFNKAYVAPDGRIKGDTQAVYVLALANDLLDETNARKAAAYLVADIEAKGNHLSTGFIGTKDLMLVLSKIGREDVALRLLHNDTFPSWGFSIKQGATSIWERWDGWTPENGFQDPGMNSFAHYSFGAVYQWMVENLGGIHSDGLAYKAVRIQPVFDPKLNECRTTYESIRGTIVSDWRRTAAGIVLTVTVPANTRGEVVLNVADPASLTESGKPVEKLVKREDGRVALPIGSGTYRFAFTPK